VKLTPTELAYVRSQGLYITEKCDGCGKLLNQSFRYTMANRPEVYCSAVCQDKAMGWDRVRSQRAGTEKATQPAFAMPVCQRCGKRFRAKCRDARFCSQRCQKWDQRKRLRENGTPEGAIVRETDFAPSPEAHKQRVK
jgi:endogenous inhibitor of DNA gyrase (YacG/DUF329 family)